jgi:hypothetical protein
MDAQSQVEILRLHCEHLRTLLDEVIIKRTTIERALATKENSSSALVAIRLNELEKQNAHLATESVRLQSFLHSLAPLSTDASEAGGGSPPSSPPPADTSQRGRDKIEGRLGGKEAAGILYQRYVDSENRTFPNDRYPIPVDDYLSGREKGMH